MKIHFAESLYKIDPSFKKKYVDKIETSYNQVNRLLPFGSKHINFFVQPREYDLIPETQDAGYTVNSELVMLAFNPNAPTKVLENITGTVFHEMNHAARYNIPIFHHSFLDSCVMEGLATVFAREYAGDDALWSHQVENVSNWIKEIIEQGANININDYMYSHPDGRRWIGYKVGTYIVDKAIKNSEKSVVDLTQMECLDILKLAKINIENYQV